MTFNESTYLRKALEHESNQLRVLHVIPQLAGGGTERVVCSLLPLLNLNVCKASLCVLGCRNEYPSRTNDIALDGFLGYDGSLRNPVGMIRCICRLRRLIRSERVNIVHSHLWPAARISALALRGLRCSHVVHLHDTRAWLEGRGRRDRFMQWFTGVTVLKSKANYVAVAQAVKDYTCCHLAVDDHRVHVIHNGVELERFRPRGCSARRGHERIVFGTVGNLNSDKGHRYLIDAGADLSSRGLDFEIRLAGDGSLRPDLESQVLIAGLANRVTLAGPVDDVEAFLHGLDIFVLPSVRKGFPMWILEAMACRVPVIATDVGGIREAVQDRVTGLLTPPKDVFRLVQAMLEIAAAPTLGMALAERGYRAVRKRFSSESVAKKMESLYIELGSE